MSTEKRLEIISEPSYEKKMLLHSRIRTACCLIVAVLAAFVMYHGVGISGRVYRILDSLEAVSEEIERADLTGMLGDVESLVLDAQGMVAEANGTLVRSAEGLDGALQNINAIDIETLNAAIGDLAAVVEPLANLFGR